MQQVLAFRDPTGRVYMMNESEGLPPLAEGYEWTVVMRPDDVVPDEYADEYGDEPAGEYVDERQGDEPQANEGQSDEQQPGRLVRGLGHGFLRSANGAGVRRVHCEARRRSFRRSAGHRAASCRADSRGRCTSRRCFLR